MSGECIHGSLGRQCALCEAYCDHASAVEMIEKLTAERDALRAALDNLLSACELPGEHCEIEQAIPRARAALEGKP